MTKLTVLYPAAGGVPAGFLTRLNTSIPVDASIVPLFGNSARGLVGLLLEGYRTIPLDQAVVRLDTAEHPPERIVELARLACDIDGMVIGDLSFPEGLHLVKGSVDEFAHLTLFPEIYRMATGGRLTLSCAHGFQAFSPSVVARILPRAKQILMRAEELSGGSVKWGFDGAMALAAISLGVRVHVLHIRAEVERNRQNAKIAQQAASATLMLAASSEFL